MGRMGRLAALVGLGFLACSSTAPRATGSNADASAPLPSATVPSDDGGNAVDPETDASTDAGAPDVGPAIDASAMQACTDFTGDGATCFNFTPADTGATPSGENATEPNYAVRPSGTAATSLVLFFIGSGGHPSGVVKAGPKRNFYEAAVLEGYAILGVSYTNVASLGSLCQRDDTCYFPTRKAIITGTSDPGSALTVPKDATYIDRATRALQYLAVGDPSGNWGTFLDASGDLAWSKIVAAGHSQGGGHAAALGKLFPVQRVIQLSSTCDTDGTNAATWLNGSDGTWKTDPTQFWGLGTTTDTTCPFHLASWNAEGMVDNHKNNSAEVCDETGDTHDASLKCADNLPNWRQMLR